MEEVAARGETTEERMQTHIGKCLSKKGRLLWHRVFRPRGQGEAKAKAKAEEEEEAERSPLPVKLEICSGNGDWVAAQARADAGRANWVALELKVCFNSRPLKRAPRSNTSVQPSGCAMA